jgi:xylulokinase
MGLVCFANGSLAREEVAARTGLDWEAFERALLATRPGNGGRLLLPYFVPELTPRIAVPAVRLFGPSAFVRFEERQEAARAVVEAQALTMQHHAAWMGAKPVRLLVTGGASQNDGILQVFADVFEAEVVPLALPNAAALGSALRIAHALGDPLERLVAQFAVADDARARAPAQRGAYAELRDRFVSELARLLEEEPHGRPLLQPREVAELGTSVSPSGRERGLPGLSES